MLREQLGLPEAVKLLPESDRDAQEAAMVAFGSSSGYANSRCVCSDCCLASLIIGFESGKRSALWHCQIESSKRDSATYL